METKPGYLTTEFWVMAGTNLIGILAGLGAFHGASAEDITAHYTPIVAGIGAVIANGAYIWSRAHVKANATKP